VPSCHVIWREPPEEWNLERIWDVFGLFILNPSFCTTAVVLAVLSNPRENRLFGERGLPTTHRHDSFISGRPHCVMNTLNVEEHKTPRDNVETVGQNGETLHSPHPHWLCGQFWE